MSIEFSLIRGTASDGQVGCRFFYRYAGLLMQNQSSIGHQISSMMGRISKEFGSVEKWPRLCQAEVLLYAIRQLSGENRVEGYWIEELHRICFKWSQEENSGITLGSSASREDARGLDEHSDTEYLFGKLRLHFYNHQHWTARGLEDDVWWLDVS